MLENYNIRLATLDDLDFITSLVESTFKSHVVNNGEVWVDQDKLWKSKLETEVHNILEIAGNAIGLYTVEDQQSCIDLDLLFLLPEFQGKGIGTDIVNSLIKRSKLEGKKIKLKVFKTNVGAVKLYEKLGFKVIRSTKLRYYMEFSSI